MSEELTTTNSSAPLIKANMSGLKLESMNDMFYFAKCAVASGFAPNGINDATTAMVAMQYGLELGFTPLQALNSVVVIKGKPSLPGDSAKAVVMRSGMMKSYKEEEIGEQGTDDWGYRITTERKDIDSKVVSTFTVADAKAAGLWDNDKKPIWGQYPKRMLKYRALGFNLRDNFADILKGLVITEELQDYEEPRDCTVEVLDDTVDSIMDIADSMREDLGISDDDDQIDIFDGDSDGS